MLFGVITLFPDMFYAVTKYGVTGRSVRKGILSIKLWNPRDFSGKKKYRNVDDRLYGGGAGMLMMIKPLKEAIYQAKYVLGDSSRVIYLSPQGRRLNQNFIHKLVNSNQILILVCGRYQGIDERLIKTEIDEEWSIGDYILSGGELAAMVLIDSISRILTGVLKNPKSKESDSFCLNRLDCPNYTRPRNFEGLKVPAVLLSGHHDNIMHWRLKQSLGNTWIKRPDLLVESKLTVKEKELLSEFQDEYFSSFQDKKIK